MKNHENKCILTISDKPTSDIKEIIKNQYFSKENYFNDN